MSQDLTVIYRGWQLQEAYLLRNLLIDQGIPAVVLNENVQSLRGAVPMTPETGPQVAVREEFAEQARAFALQFDTAQRRLSPTDDVPAPSNVNQLAAPGWPVCPECGAARSAKCPVCGEIAE